jgi:glutathione S-transferase
MEAGQVERLLRGVARFSAEEETDLGDLHDVPDELADFAAEQAVSSFQARTRGDASAEEAARDRMRRALAAVEARLVAKRFPRLFGVGQAAIVATAGYIALRHGRETIDAFAELSAWLAAHAERPSVASTVPVG